jgi:hypothetical protein
MAIPPSLLIGSAGPISTLGAGAPGRIGKFNGGSFVKICREVATFLQKNYVEAESSYIGILKDRSRATAGHSGSFADTRRAKDIRDSARRSSRGWFEATQYPGGITGPVTISVIDPAPPGAPDTTGE